MSNLRSSLVIGVAAAAVLSVSTAHAQSEEASASLSLSPQGVSSSSSGGGGGGEGYMYWYRPEPMTLEVGLLWGAIFPSNSHNLQDDVQFAPEQPRDIKSTALEFGARVAFFPFSFAGIEAEASVMPTKTTSPSPVGYNGTLWAGRGHIIAQLPFWSVTPFILGGYGRLAISSEANGNDGDPAFHFGVGVKVPLNCWISTRLDIRDTLTQKWGDEDTQGSAIHHPEFQLGLSATFFRKCPEAEQAAPPPPEQEPDPCSFDDDGDGFNNCDDKCPNEPGVAPDGCPLPDRDRDGIPDEVDACPDEPGVEQEDPTKNGCPIPLDRDGDGILDADDACPDDPGKANEDPNKHGCPLAVVSDEEIRIMERVEFDTNRATIRPESVPVLTVVLEILQQHPEILKLDVRGHTDNKGVPYLNMTLSKNRAAAVVKWLTDRGIAKDRLTSQGFGQTRPIDTNDTDAGRQNNRRVEFRITERTPKGESGTTP